MNNLVKDEIVAGWERLDALKADGFPMDMAFWQYVEGAEQWRLFIVSPGVWDEEVDPYACLHKVLDKLPTDVDELFSYANVGIVSPNDLRGRDIRKWYGVVEPRREAQRCAKLTPDVPCVYFVNPESVTAKTG